MKELKSENKVQYRRNENREDNHEGQAENM